MKDKIWFYLFFSFSIRAVHSYDSTDKYSYVQRARDPKCWKSFRGQELFQFMEKIDKEYATARKDAQKYLDKSNFTKRILEKISVQGAVNPRDNPEQRRYRAKIPAGINLGGLCTMTLPNFVLFFHRMKLRNDTFFQVKDLHNVIENMVLKGQLLLNGLHLRGAYDRSLTNKSSSILKHTNSYGELQIFMEDVQYAIEGRYVMKNDRLVIVHIVSTLDTKNATLTVPLLCEYMCNQCSHIVLFLKCNYTTDTTQLLQKKKDKRKMMIFQHANANETDPPIWLNKQNMGDFMLRLKADLDNWVKDYFNDYLIVSRLEDVPSISKLREYDQHKSVQLAKFMDNAIIRMNKKLRNIGGDTMRIPYLKITASPNMTIQVYAGTLRGLDTMYRRSEATTTLKKKNLRTVDTIIGFRDLKVSYAYEIQFPPSSQMLPTVTGVLIMSANQQTAHLTLELLNETEILELDIDFLNRMGANAITIEGATNILMSNFKHILHHEIATIMSNSLIHSIQLLKSLPNCDPLSMIKQNFKLNIIKEHPSSKRRRAPMNRVIEELRKTSKMMPTLTR